MCPRHTKPRVKSTTSCICGLESNPQQVVFAIKYATFCAVTNILRFTSSDTNYTLGQLEKVFNIPN